MRTIPTFAIGLVLGVLAMPANAVTPVASVRVAFDRNGATDTQASGLADVAAKRVVDADDPVRVASISKLVTAIGAMRLVEEGKLDLDADLSPLLGWRLRNPAFPDAQVTLRLLLSHRAGLTDAAGYYAIPLDGALRDTTDDLRAWDQAHPPGTFFRYTNLNFAVVASAMERASGERFDKLMQRLIFAPLKIDACFNWATCSDAKAARAIVLYDAAGKPVRDDNGGRKPECAVNRSTKGDCDLSQWKPGRNGALFSPQGGLRISANDLAKIGRLLLNDGEVDGVRLLKPASIREMEQPLWTFEPGNGLTVEEDDSSQSQRGFYCRYGLAAQTLATKREGCRDDPFGDGMQRIGHAGAAYGLLSGVWIDRASGTGVVYFATGVEDAPRGTVSAFTEVEERLARGSR